MAHIVEISALEEALNDLCFVRDALEKLAQPCKCGLSPLYGGMDAVYNRGIDRLEQVKFLLDMVRNLLRIADGDLQVSLRKPWTLLPRCENCGVAMDARQASAHGGWCDVCAGVVCRIR